MVVKVGCSARPLSSPPSRFLPSPPPPQPVATPHPPTPPSWALLFPPRLLCSLKSLSFLPPPQGFFWAFLSGVSEPIGGLLGYLVLDGDNDLSFAIVFGIVGGECVWGCERGVDRLCVTLRRCLPAAPPASPAAMARPCRCHFAPQTAEPHLGPPPLPPTLYPPCTAGMMVYISIKELIPTALRYDPKDTLATTTVVAGMVVMAGSLLLFTI